MGFALKLAKVPQSEIDTKVREAAHVLDLDEHLDRKPTNLSGGQRQRVAMGRAIVRDPQAFLMDEPLSNLDAKLRVQMRTEVSRLQRDLSTTTVYVTHDQTEAMTLGDRVAVMRSGVLQQVDTPRMLYNDPVNIFVAGFIGSPAMNFFSDEGDEVSSDELAELARDSGVAETPSGGAGQAVARLNPESEVTQGERAALWFDAAKLHLFDPADGTNLRQSEQRQAAGAAAAHEAIEAEAGVAEPEPEPEPEPKDSTPE